MSLNRAEQILYDYVGKHPEERHYWMHKVRRTAELCGDLSHASSRLDHDLRNYLRERATIIPELRTIIQPASGAGLSMRNLAEYLMRLWVPRPVHAPASKGREAKSS